MLKPAEPHPPPEDDRSIGELIERLLDDALDYGRAELDLIKARALEIAQSYVRAAILFAVAAVIGIAGLVTLFVGIALALARWIGPLGGALVSTLFAAALAGLLVWLALRDLGENQ
jgi:type VI protein secretion system component VasF